MKFPATTRGYSMVKIARFNDAFNAGHVRPQKKFWNNYVYPIKRYYNILKFEFSATLLLKLAKTQSLKCYMIWLHRHISKHFLVKSSFKYGSTIICIATPLSSSKKLQWDSNLTFLVFLVMPTLASWIFLYKKRYTDPHGEERKRNKTAVTWNKNRYNIFNRYSTSAS